MRYEILIVLMLVVGTCAYCVDMIQNKQLEKGIRFCEKVENLLDAYHDGVGVIVSSVSQKYIAKREYYNVVYDPKNTRSFFLQMESGIADALDEYDRIKDSEFNYVEEDWECIVEHYEGLNELSSRVRYETWKRGFKKK